jgi:hypothetical protein
MLYKLAATALCVGISALFSPSFAGDFSSSNVQNSNTVNQSALVALRLKADEDSTKIFMDACAGGRDLSSSLSKKQSFAAAGYDLASIPYDAIDAPDEFCRCAIKVALTANAVAQKMTGAGKSADFSFSDEDMRRVMLLSKTTTGSSACKAGKYRVEFKADGLALFKNGAAVFGTERMLIGGKEISKSNVTSQSWVE